MTIDASPERALGRIEGKLDSLVGALDAHLHAHEGLDSRLLKLENKQHWYAGIASAIGAALGVISGHKF